MDDWKWLESTDDLQRNTYGYVYDSWDEEMLCDYLDWNQTAAVQELAELREEFFWKPWATDAPFVNRDRILSEAVDVNHFIGNMLVALGVTDEEYEEAYRAKQDKNRRRAASGTYSAKKGGLAEGSDNE
jgi:hypothetical protein